MQTQQLNTTEGAHESRPFLKFFVEGREFKWHQQFISEDQVREIAGLGKEGELFLSITEPWQDEQIKPGEQIDLARTGIEQFFIRRTLPYVINNVKHESKSQYIRGLRIRRQGNIPLDQEIFLVIEKPWDDELITDETWVNLARPGIEQFVSRVVDHKVIIFVNAVEKSWNKKKITFKEVVILEYGSFNPNPDITYSVTYKNGPKENPQGIMHEEETLLVKNKMNFYVTRANRS